MKEAMPNFIKCDYSYCLFLMMNLDKAVLSSKHIGCVDLRKRKSTLILDWIGLVWIGWVDRWMDG